MRFPRVYIIYNTWKNTLAGVSDLLIVSNTKGVKQHLR
jgi:hypothetical protein